MLDPGGPTGVPPVYEDSPPGYQQAANFVYGTTAQFCDDLAVGIPSFVQRIITGGIDQSDNTSDAYQRGRRVGRLASTAHGIIEIGVGSVTLGGSGALELVTAGGASPVVIPVAAVGVGEIAHGGAVIYHNATNPLGGSSGSDYYHEGKEYTREQLEEMGAVQTRRDTEKVKSPSFKDFIRSQGRSFKRKWYDKVMETWMLPDGTEVENHYWRDSRTGDTWYHD